MNISQAMKILSDEQVKLIHQIAKKAVALAPKNLDIMTVEMDLYATNATIPLDLERMADADEFNLMHDIFGIAAHLNRDTLEIEDCFCPRYALPAPAPGDNEEVVGLNYADDGMRLTDCCAAYSHSQWGHIRCLECGLEVPAGQGDGSEFKA